jgi:hypothetical protein
MGAGPARVLCIFKNTTLHNVFLGFRKSIPQRDCRRRGARSSSCARPASMARLVMCTAGVLAVLLRSCSETLSIQPSAERTEIIGRDPTIDAIPSACGRQSAPKLPCLSKGRKTTFADRPIELYLRGGRAEDHSEDGEGAGEGASDNLPVCSRDGAVSLTPGVMATRGNRGGK